MNSITHTNDYKNLGASQRVSRMLLAAALIGVASNAPVLGGLALLPLLAIYPLVTAFIGWDPVRDLFKTQQRRDGRLTGGERGEMAVIGIALLATAFIPAVNSMVVLPLAGIYPALVALFGEDPLAGIAATFNGAAARPAAAKSAASVAASVHALRTTRRSNPRVKAA